MAVPSVRIGDNGVWRQQEAARVALEQRLAERDAQLMEALAEVDRVHAQCVGLLRANRELEASLSQTRALLVRRDDELVAANANIAELTAVLETANEDCARLERERNSTAQLWHHARDQETQAIKAIGQLQSLHISDENEARQLRDMMYEVQEQCAYQEEQLARQRHEIDVLKHSNETKDSQVVALVRERDGFAQKLAQYRSSLHRNGTATHNPTSTPPKREETESPLHAPASKSGLDDMMAEYDEEKHKLVIIAQQAKARYKREKEHSTTLQAKLEALETKYNELLVRFREASKARQQRPSHQQVAMNGQAHVEAA